MSDNQTDKPCMLQWQLQAHLAHGVCVGSVDNSPLPLHKRHLISKLQESRHGFLHWMMQAFSPMTWHRT